MHVAIIGNGIAGITCALEIRKRARHARISVISAESDHHWSRPALMYIYMGHMGYQQTKPYPDDFWKAQGIELVRGWVSEIDCTRRQLTVDGFQVMTWDKLVIATGSQPNKFGWPGQDLDRVFGMYSLQDLAAIERCSDGLRHAAIVGGGLIGIELAEMFHSRGIHVSFLVRETNYWNNILPDDEARLINDETRAHGIDLRLATELKEIVGNAEGQACAVIDSTGDRLEVGFVGLTAGVRPNIAAVRGSAIETGRGILVDQNLQTNVPGVFAVGDCAEIVTPEGQRNMIQAVWYTGRLQGVVAAQGICGTPTPYDPGIWFNAAKFWDLEYMVFGRVPSALDEQAGRGAESRYWQHSNGRHALRLVHEQGKVIGINVMGMRVRHKVCEAWIAAGASLKTVLEQWRTAHFDVEFSRRHDGEIRQAMRSAA